MNRHSAAIARQASEGAERLWPLPSHAGAWGATFPPAQPMLTSDVSSPGYYTQTAQQGGFCGGASPSGGYSPFQALAHRPIGQSGRVPDWAPDLPRPPRHHHYQQGGYSRQLPQHDVQWEVHGYNSMHEPMDRTVQRGMEAAPQLPAGFRPPPLFSAVGRVALTQSNTNTNSGDGSGSGASLASPEGTMRGRMPGMDTPFRTRTTLSAAHSDVDAYFHSAAAAAIYASGTAQVRDHIILFIACPLTLR